MLLNMLTSEYITIENPLDEAMEFRDLENFFLVMWSGDLDDDRLLLHFCKSGTWMQPLRCRGALALDKKWTGWCKTRTKESCL
ncbi:unnamed protein product [Parnassius apollo]|uniref:(apollo) hypothetical protein n=1 Tax=Parnassius apollo TaxID=110799 RepID=A0A8S3XR41_PARAO|nr:unnamed protein product [Parnassius apollo]